MAEPDMHRDESIILKTPNVFVKSIPFEAILTNKRIILVDRKKDLIPAKDILLATVRDIEPGENAIRDQIINLSIITTTGETRQVVLTFSREAGGNRKRERDEWVKALKQHTSSSFQQAIRKVIPVFDQEPGPKPQEPPIPKIEIAGRPAAKKEIDAVQPLKKIVETSNAPPKPVETTSLPEGSFCNMCGNRVPVGSLFCNRCGAKIAPSDWEKPAESATPKVPEISGTPPAPLEFQPGGKETPHIPMVTAAQLERKERPIEEVIRSIEPLIEGSVPRSEPSPLVPSPATAPGSAETEKTAVEQVTIPPVFAIPAKPPIATTPTPPPKKRSIFPQLFLKKDLPQQPAPAAAPPAPPSPPPSPPAAAPAPTARRKSFITLAVIVLVITAIAGGAFVFMGSMGGTPSVPAPAPTTLPTILPTTPVPTPVPTTLPPVTTAVPTMVPTPLIPQTGVWVKVEYDGGWKGSFGVPGNLQQVTGTGDRFSQIPAAEDGTVWVSIQKIDGSANELVVNVYKSGVLVQSGRTTTPKGTVEYLADLKMVTPTATPTVKLTAVIANATQTQKPATPARNVTMANTTAPATATTTSS